MVVVVVVVVVVVGSVRTLEMCLEESVANSMDFGKERRTDEEEKKKKEKFLGFARWFHLALPFLDLACPSPSYVNTTRGLANAKPLPQSIRAYRSPGTVDKSIFLRTYKGKGKRK